MMSIQVIAVPIVHPAHDRLPPVDVQHLGVIPRVDGRLHTPGLDLYPAPDALYQRIDKRLLVGKGRGMNADQEPDYRDLVRVLSVTALQALDQRVHVTAVR